MLFRRLEPSFGERQGQWNSNQHADTRDGKDKVKQLPREVAPAGTQPATPAPADVTLAGDDAVEQDEAHYARCKHQNDSEGEGGDDDSCDESSQQRMINR